MQRVLAAYRSGRLIGVLHSDGGLEDVFRRCAALDSASGLRQDEWVDDAALAQPAAALALAQPAAALAAAAAAAAAALALALALAAAAAAAALPDTRATA